MDKRSLSNNVAWNMIGSIFYFACQWLISVVVVLLSDGYKDAGTLSLAMSLTNIFATVAFFNVRNLQVSDSVGEYSVSEYHTHRLLTCGLALLLCTGFVLINGYDLYLSLSILLYMTVRLIEAYEDVLQGMVQNKWRLDVAGKSLIMRGILLITVFSAVQYFFHSLPLSIGAMALSSLLVLFLYDIGHVRAISPFGISGDVGKLKKLSLLCLPMLLYGIATNSIVSGARYFIEAIHGEETLGYYATVSTIAVLVQTFVTLIFTPFAGVFEAAHREGRRRDVSSLFLKLVILLAGVTVLAFLAVLVAGDFAMSLIFGEEILPYVYLLYPTVAASALTALMWLLGMILVVIRDTKTLILGGFAGLAVCMILCLIMIPSAPYFGANTAILCGLGMVCLIFLCRFIAYLFSKNKLDKEES